MLLFPDSLVEEKSQTDQEMMNMETDQMVDTDYIAQVKTEGIVGHTDQEAEEEQRDYIVSVDYRTMDHCYYCYLVDSTLLHPFD